MFYDLGTGRVIGLVEGRDKMAARRFLRNWGKEKRASVRAVCMDMWDPFITSVRHYLPSADIGFDKFHIFKYLNLAVDEVRKAEQSIAEADGYQTLKGSRWLWFKKDLTHRQKETLEQIMELNKNMDKAYILKEDFERFYACETVEEAEEFMKDWVKRCKSSKLYPFVRFSDRLRKWNDGIFSFFNHRITNGMAEGINNKIKVIKRRSYGFHDFEYFTLKVLKHTGFIPDMTLFTHNFQE